MEVKANNFYFECDWCKKVRVGFMKSQLTNFVKQHIMTVYCCNVCRQPSVVTSKFPNKDE